MLEIVKNLPYVRFNLPDIIGIVSLAIYVNTVSTSLFYFFTHDIPDFVHVQFVSE